MLARGHGIQSDSRVFGALRGQAGDGRGVLLTQHHFLPPSTLKSALTSFLLFPLPPSCDPRIPFVSVCPHVSGLDSPLSFSFAPTRAQATIVSHFNFTRTSNGCLPASSLAPDQSLVLRVAKWTHFACKTDVVQALCPLLPSPHTPLSPMYLKLYHSWSYGSTGTLSWLVPMFDTFVP